MQQPSDKAIEYQLEKVDQGGAVMELFEERMSFLASEWGFSLDEETGEIVLPDGRRAGLVMQAYIEDRD